MVCVHIVQRGKSDRVLVSLMGCKDLNSIE